MITITNIKVVGLCSKHRKEGDKIPRDKHGNVIPDEDIDCIAEKLNCESEKEEFEDIWNNNTGIKDVETINKMMREAKEQGIEKAINIIRENEPCKILRDIVNKLIEEKNGQ